MRRLGTCSFDKGKQGGGLGSRQKRREGSADRIKTYRTSRPALLKLDTELILSEYADRIIDFQHTMPCGGMLFSGIRDTARQHPDSN
jgi:hypothetical protein